MCLPDPASWSQEDTVSIAIDPAKLITLAAALMSAESKALTLIMKKNSFLPGKGDQREVSTPICVVGDTGIGVMAAMAPDGITDLKIKRFNEMRQEYQSTFAKPE